MSITTHVLDTARGLPAEGVSVALERRIGANRWQHVGHGETDADGRVRTLLPAGVALDAGAYRLVFDSARYFHSQRVQAFYPEVIVTFEVASGDFHYHVPLLLSPFGYTTYRGS